MSADHLSKLPLAEQVLPCPCDCCGVRPAAEVVFGWVFLCLKCGKDLNKRTFCAINNRADKGVTTSTGPDHIPTLEGGSAHG